MAQSKPPYTSTVDVETFLDKIKPLGPPATVDAGWVEKYDMAVQQASGIVALTKWLGIVGDDGTTNREVWNEVRLPASQKATLDRLIRESYAAVFAAIDNIEEADRALLTSTFVHEYDLGDSRRYLACFLKLCEIAGIETKAGSRGAGEGRAKVDVPRRATTRREKATATTKGVTGGRRSSGTGGGVQGSRNGLPVSISLNVEIPPEWDEEQIRERLAIVTKAVQGG